MRNAPSGPYPGRGQITIPAVAIGAAGTSEVTGTVIGARLGDAVGFAPRAAPDAGLAFYARVSADDTVAIGAVNATAGGITPAAPIVFDVWAQSVAAG